MQGASSRQDVVAELWFYAYAHRPEREQRREALARLKAALLAGVRSPGWSLATDIESALSAGHPAGEWLRQLAAVICNDASIETLDAWDEWKLVAMPDPAPRSV